MSSVMLACGHRAQGTHGQAHDGLIEHHPSCVICASGQPDDPACRVVPPPLLEGRTARCAYYGGRWGRSGGPIYPDDRTRNNGMCDPARGCVCIVPSSIDLPFFEYGQSPWEKHCAIETPTGPCLFGSSAHDAARLPNDLIAITTRYDGRCSHCGQPIRTGRPARWDREHSRIYHPEADCPPLQHAFVERTGLGDDLYFCGCAGWD